MLASLEAGHPVELPEEPTLASALAGGIGLENLVTFALVRDFVDEHVIVKEDEITKAMTFAYRDLGLVVEGGGAVGLAVLLTGRIRASGPLVIVVSGGNVSLDTLREVMAAAPSGD